MKATLNPATRSGFAGPRYFSFHARLHGLFDVLALGLFLLLVGLAAITYIASALMSLMRFLGRILFAWIPTAAGHIDRPRLGSPEQQEGTNLLLTRPIR